MTVPVQHTLQTGGGCDRLPPTHVEAVNEDEDVAAAIHLITQGGERPYGPEFPSRPGGFVFFFQKISGECFDGCSAALTEKMSRKSLAISRTEATVVLQTLGHLFVVQTEGCQAEPKVLGAVFARFYAITREVVPVGWTGGAAELLSVR